MMNTQEDSQQLPQLSTSQPSTKKAGIKGFFYLLWLGLRRLGLELNYWSHLILHSARHQLRWEAGFTLVGALVFFGLVVTQDLATSMQALLNYGYMFFTISMILLAMNVLPRERDQGTLEMLWSQPISRGTLIIVQMIVLAVWSALLAGIIAGFLFFFTVFSQGLGYWMLFVWTTAIAVGASTLLISALCRHAIAAGLVTLLLFGIHYFWLNQLGPIELYFNPLSSEGLREQVSSFDLYFNRIVLLIFVGFVLDYLFRRLRQTAEWFT